MNKRGFIHRQSANRIKSKFSFNGVSSYGYNIYIDDCDEIINDDKEHDIFDDLPVADD